MNAWFKCTLQTMGPLYKVGNGTQNTSVQTVGRYELCEHVCTRTACGWHVRAHKLMSGSMKTRNFDNPTLNRKFELIEPEGTRPNLVSREGRDSPRMVCSFSCYSPPVLRSSI